MVMATTATTAPTTSIASVVLEVPDPEAAHRFYTAFGVDTHIRLRASEAHSAGFRGFTLALTVSRPATVDSFLRAGVNAGATTLKPAEKSLWGYGGVLQAPDGTVWKIATSAKKDTGPATREIDEIVLLLGVEDVKASFGGKYAEFASGVSSPVKLALYKRRGLAKDLGVPAYGTGSHRIVLGSTAGSFTDPDGFVWETATSLTPAPSTASAQS
ncbi:VOC family protein [Streptomyces sp. Ru62]|uniref:VOC family protein n=1 Tax=Streptomyces sp. Ru62 TaxID=2080745 RepID=UPI0015E34408|nr:glyoxalase [Streptomyces sp. Ru62]